VAIPSSSRAASRTSIITRRIYAFCHDLVGGIPGGLGHVNVAGSLVFAGMSGSALADLGGLGQIEIKAMLDAGYEKKFTLGVTLASSILGPLIPPSIPAVIYASNAEVSVTALFLAGIGPGLLMAAIQLVCVYVIAVRRGFPREATPGAARLARSGLAALPALLAPLLLVGGMTLGVFTPTEAAMVAVCYSLLLGMAVYRELRIGDVVRVTVELAREVASLMMVIAMGLIFGWILTVEQVPQAMAGAILNFAERRPWSGRDQRPSCSSGCFVEGPALLLNPILAPALASIGSIVHFGT
jgi:tripartite ATP-independent transporter DctM subunit